ncbi:hypothetical protein B9Z19DRAFT_1134971 [Tuber borchii]|uniref:Uncharacterized protein n=1 Tax=Tuber borchii TaxID=42251 RepID=A0A2T6ZDI6_TUBBO|nr:hypothetical protein B9Z19DRAFT_1134971 [Tuber borchii]
MNWVYLETAPPKFPPRAGNGYRERSDGIASTNSNLRYATPLEVSNTKIGATGDAGKPIHRSFLENVAAGYMQRLDGHNGSGAVSRDTKHMLPHFPFCCANVPGITDSNISVITPEWDILLIDSSQSGKQNGLWMPVESDGKVSSSIG